MRQLWALPRRVRPWATVPRVGSASGARRSPGVNTSLGLPQPPAHVHFVGIGGAGMSGLARILAASGYRVTGTDAISSDLISLLRCEGIDITIGHAATANAAAADLIVATAALRDPNPEIRAALANDVRVIKRAEMLGLLANARRCVAVAGSHGKSTTSGMLVSALTALGQD